MFSIHPLLTASPEASRTLPQRRTVPHPKHLGISMTQHVLGARSRFFHPLLAGETSPRFAGLTQASLSKGPSFVNLTAFIYFPRCFYHLWRSLTVWKFPTASAIS